MENIVKSTIQHEHEPLELLKILFDAGREKLEITMEKPIPDYWDKGAWEEPYFIEKTMLFVQKRYARLKGIGSKYPSTITEALKSQIDKMTCPFVVSPEALEFGKFLADFGEVITLGLLVAEAKQKPTPGLLFMEEKGRA